ncbi:TolB family protein [Winogradskyella thalassocola]|uniref:WD40-like Beta Propeller Repeat n=1 Tax=Winogradskyella thalassocola TaxID=262004 RepID=A0A1G8AZV4_9FLAO|nr:PD40 domain-containing protein [Winogradskyella thalassocola]SDH26552.1 WD40-like Beta Propeller Repeat [Winogradskyella thalassocola]
MLKLKFTLLFLFFISFGFSQEIEVKKLEINTKLDHFAARVVNDKVFFSSNLVTKRGRAISDHFSQELFGVYSGTVGNNGEIKDAEMIKKTEYGQFNMSVTTHSRDGKYMYFTGNHSKKGEDKLKDEKVYNLLITRAEYVEDEGWTNFVDLPFCDPAFNYAHPALSPDGSTLYFIADVEGTKGKSDLYKVSVSDHKSYGEVTKLSDSINSSRTELYPFVSTDNKLYFSSDRKGGKGSLDVYSYDLENDDPEQIAVSLDEPINSIGDDFSFFLNDDLSTGYLSSRRLRGEGRDDLYYFSGFKSKN